MLAIRTFAGGQPVAVSSTGRWIAYVLTDQDDEWNVQEPRPTGHVHVQALAGGRPGAPRALTSGAVHSAFPVWSPDGRRLAFIREEQGRGRAVVWDAERDQMTPVGDTFAARIYLAPQWDPSGKTLIVAAALPETPAQPYRVRSVKSTDARIPGDQFFTDERKATLTAIDVASGASHGAHAGAGRAAIVPRVADRPPAAVRGAGAGDARRHRQGAERHVRAADRSARRRARRPRRGSWPSAAASPGRPTASR